MKRELQSPEDFEQAVREEISISAEFGLPLCAFVLHSPGGPDTCLVRRLLDNLRSGDCVTLYPPDELAVVLPNTPCEAAGPVRERLLAAAPGTALGDADLEPGDTPQTLLHRARRSAER